MIMRIVQVYNNNIYAGLLTETDAHTYLFAYDSQYLNSNHASISLTLPKREETYQSPTLFPFFANLLPEGANRRAVCRHYKIDEHDDMGILMAFSQKDFIGSIGIKTIET